MYHTELLIKELKNHSPEIIASVNKAVKNSTADLDFIRLEKQAFEVCPSISIDYALMEKSSNIVVIPLEAGWSDVGSWSTLHNIGTKDSYGNVFRGDVFAKDTIPIPCSLLCNIVLLTKSCFLFNKCSNLRI